jgi:large subunit ribosomal protein L3
MPAMKRPRRGSKAYWPRKRAARVYPRIKSYPEGGKTAEKAKALAFAAYKAGMLQATIVDNVKGSATFGQESVIPVTVLDCPPVRVVGVRLYSSSPKGLVVLQEVPADRKTDELDKLDKIAAAAEKVSKISNVRLVVATQPKLAGFGKKNPDLLEIEIGGKDAKEKLDFAKERLGKEVGAGDVVQEGGYVDAIAVTAGKGTVGPVKRFGIKIQTRHAHGKRRHTGSLGQERPGKVRPTVPQAGQLGMQRRTESNKRVLKIADGKDITPKAGFNHYGVVRGACIVIEGSVPGPRKRLIVLRQPMRANRPVAPVEIKEIIK